MEITTKKLEKPWISFTKRAGGYHDIRFGGIRSSKYFPKEFFKDVPYFYLSGDDKNLIIYFSKEERGYFDLSQEEAVLPSETKEIIKTMEAANKKLEQLMKKEENKNIGIEEVYEF